MKLLDRDYYSKFSSIENYLFNDVHNNFLKNHKLTVTEFYSIVIWKANRAKGYIKNGLLEAKTTVNQLTSRIYSTENIRGKIELLTNINGIGYPIASAILTVCYPDEFTIVDYRAVRSLKRYGIAMNGNPSTNINSYLNYVSICKKTAQDNHLTLRELDKYLWGYDFIEGRNGLIEFTKGLE
jgi:thermostable 8-oxoguanine DNA glycosylase